MTEPSTAAGRAMLKHQVDAQRFPDAANRWAGSIRAIEAEARAAALDEARAAQWDEDRLTDWQRFTHDAEDIDPPERCAFPSHGHGSHRGHPDCRTCQETMGICLRRKGHPVDWHEGRSISGNLVSWPAKEDDR